MTSEQKLLDPEYRDNMIKFYYENNIILEVKTCEVNEKFTFQRDTHRFLQCQNGYYLFLVKTKDTVLRHSLIKAQDLDFSRVIPWSMVMGV